MVSLLAAKPQTSVRRGCHSHTTTFKGISVPVQAKRSRHGPRNSAAKLVTRALAEPSESVPFASSADHLSDWNVDSWREYVALQQPNYPDQVCNNNWS